MQQHAGTRSREDTEEEEATVQQKKNEKKRMHYTLSKVVHLNVCEVGGRVNLDCKLLFYQLKLKIFLENINIIKGC